MRPKKHKTTGSNDLFRARLGHLKAEGHLGRCHLKGRSGDAANLRRDVLPAFSREDQTFGSHNTLLLLR